MFYKNSLVTPLYVKSDLQWGNPALQHCCSGTTVQKVSISIPMPIPWFSLKCGCRSLPWPDGTSPPRPGNPLVFGWRARQGLPLHFQAIGSTLWLLIHWKLASSIPNNFFNSCFAGDLKGLDGMQCLVSPYGTSVTADKRAQAWPATHWTHLINRDCHMCVPSDTDKRASRAM